MFGELVPISLFLSIAFIAVGIAKVLADNRTRRQMIQAQLSPEQAQAILAPMRRDPDLARTLKWSLVIGSVGLALIVLEFLPYQADEPFGYGLILVFAAVGLATYLGLARRVA